MNQNNVLNSPELQVADISNDQEKSQNHIRPENQQASSSQPVFKVIQYDYDKMIFFLSALNCDYLVEEWIPILLNICSFVHTMYEGRKRLYDQLDIDNRNISQDDS